MTQILVVGSSILIAGAMALEADRVVCNEVGFPFNAIPGYQIIEAGLLPADFSTRKYIWSGGIVTVDPAYIPPADPASASELSDISKASYAASLQRQAAKLQAAGNTYKAVQLLLKAQGV